MAGESPTPAIATDRDVSLAVRAEIKQHLYSSLVLDEGDDTKFPYASKDFEKAYIRIQDIEDAWSAPGRDTIAKALYPAQLTSEYIAYVRKELLTFLSLLVWLDAHTQLDRFRDYLKDSDGCEQCSNDKLPLQLKNVPDFGDLMFRRRFWREQFIFTPKVISEASEPMVVDKDIRLPFEAYALETSEGAFGQVQKVTISPRYFVTEDGIKASEVKVVAVKRFPPQNRGSAQDAAKEIRNLVVLKESITRHKNIRTHLAAIFHRGEHIILLPWADRYDLHVFLLEGHDQKQRIYDFKAVFPCISQDDLIRDSYRQLANIAAALKWLHEDVKPHRKQMYFAHMDLKPDNILIDNETPRERSAVGRWVLTDFGISAVKENDEDANYMTIRDYAVRQNLTMNTTARRGIGAYQPPEIESLEQSFHGLHNVPQSKRAGRRGDIWSFGCIFSEVVAFCAGRAKFVNAFRAARTAGYGNDYFHKMLPTPFLDPDRSGQTHELRPEMVDWLRRLASDVETPLIANKVIACSVDSVFKLLKTSGDDRPRAVQVLGIMEHLKSHFDPALQSNLRCTAGLSAHHLQTSPAVDGAELLTDVAAPPPIILHPAPAEDENSAPASDRDPGRPAEIHGAANIPQDDEEDRHDTSILLGGDSRTQNLRGRDEGPEIDHLLHSSGSSEAPTISPRHSSTDSQERDEGILGLSPNLRSLRETVLSRGAHTSAVKVEHIALCSTGSFIATITRPRLFSTSRYTLRRFKLSLDNLSVTLDPLPALPTARSWDGLYVHLDMIVAWGDKQKNTRQVLLSFAGSQHSWLSSDYTWLATLRTVVVSKERGIFFLCHNSIFVVDLRTEDKIPSEFAVTEQGHRFKHIAVSDDTGILYAWSCGTRYETLHLWRLAVVNSALEVAFEGWQNYEARTHGDYKALIFPFDGRQGCAIRLDGAQFMCSPPHMTSKILPRDESDFHQRSKVCVYGGSSMLFAEKNMTRTDLSERLISRASNSIKRKGQRFIAQVNISMDDIADMRVVSMPPKDGLIIIVVATDGRTFFIPFTT